MAGKSDDRLSTQLDHPQIPSQEPPPLMRGSIKKPPTINLELNDPLLGKLGNLVAVAMIAEPIMAKKPPIRGINRGNIRRESSLIAKISTIVVKTQEAGR